MSTGLNHFRAPAAPGESEGPILHYRLEGPEGAPLLVFVNSLGTDLRIWEPLLPSLSRRFRILRLDKRGHGLSAGGESDLSIEILSKDLGALMDRLDLAQAVVVGLSVGGLIAQDLAARRPDLVRALVLADTAARIGDRELWQQRIDKVRADGLTAIADSILERWFTPTYRKAQPEALAFWKTLLTRTTDRGYAAVCAALRDADLTQQTRRLSLPCLCLCGAEDLATTPDLVRGTADLIAGARFETIPGAGHLPCIEQPEAFLRHLIGFLEGLETPAGDRRAAGMAVRRAVLGDEHVDRAEAARTPFDEAFQTLITEGAWGSVWARPGLSRAERSTLTIALLAALGQQEELAMHVRATARTGATPEEVKEALLHVAIYAGVPAANAAIRTAKAAYAEIGVNLEEDKA